MQRPWKCCPLQGRPEWTATDQRQAASFSAERPRRPLVSRTQVILQRKAWRIYLELNKFKPERTVFSWKLWSDIIIIQKRSWINLGEYGALYFSYTSIYDLWRSNVCAWALSHSVVCDSLWPHGRSLSVSSVHGILQTRILEWGDIPFSRGSSWPRIKPMSPASPALAGGFFTTEPPGKPKVQTQ